MDVTNSRWTEFKDLFLLGSLIPPVFRKPSTRSDAKLFRQLFRMAGRQPSLLFWKDMASHEVSVKGKPGTQLSIEIPPGMDTMYGTNSSGEEENGIIKDTDDHIEPKAGEKSAKMQKTGTSFSTSRSVMLKFPDDTDAFFSSQGRASGNAQVGHVCPGLSSSIFVGQNKFHTFARRTKFSRKCKDKVRIEGRGDGASKSSLFEYSLRDCIEHIFHEGCHADEMLRIFEATLQIQNEPEHAQIQSWLRTKEFNPLLVQVHNPTLSATIDGNLSHDTSSEIGDIQKSRRKYHLANVSDAEELRGQILSLGRLYLQARNYELTKLIELIRHKMQAAWNFYPGLCQLQPVLEVTMMAFKARPEHREHDTLQKWLIEFLADTQDLFTYDCAEKWWGLMSELPDLFSEISQVRTEMHRRHPERYEDLSSLLYSRGINSI
jgi:hypothetical protein